MSAVVRLYEPGGPEALRYESETVGEPAAGQLRIRQEAIGVNYVDTYFRSGRFPLPVLPAVIGGEGAGVVDAVGEGVDSISVGDRIGYYFSPGAYAEIRLLAAAEAIPLPHDLGPTEAASLLAQGLTAWGRLFRVHAVRPGDVVLVTGATGGVGSLLATWAQHLGATVITPVASKDRVEAAEALGLQHVVVAGTGQLSEAMAEVGGKADVVYDLVGRATFAVPGLARWCLRQTSRPHLSAGRRGPGSSRSRSRHPRSRGCSSPAQRLIPKVRGDSHLLLDLVARVRWRCVWRRGV